MIRKIAILFVASLVACSAFAIEWPADLLPGLCPDYPNCDVEVLAKFMPDGHPRTIDIPIARSPFPARKRNNWVPCSQDEICSTWGTGRSGQLLFG